MGEGPADFFEFAHACSGRLFRTACLLTGDWHLAEDLVQETLAKVYRAWRRIDHSVPPTGYAQTVLIRTFISLRRRRSSSERPVEAVPESAGPVDDAELRLALTDALAKLSVKDRAVLVLRYWEDQSVEETAEVLRVSQGAVRVRSVRALARLRAILGEDLADLARS